MELNVTGRVTGKKSEIKNIRREGNIPAVFYSKGEKGKEIIVDGTEFQKVINKTEKGTLSSTVFNLKLDGKSIKAIVKDIQYAVTTYNVLHIDFAELHDDVPVTLNIPIKFLNAVECAGVKLGGVLRQVVRYVKVCCLPKDIPDRFNLDVRDLVMGQSLKLSTVKMPSGVTPITNMNEIAVIVAKK